MRCHHNKWGFASEARRLRTHRRQTVTGTQRKLVSPCPLLDLYFSPEVWPWCAAYSSEVAKLGDSSRHNTGMGSDGQAHRCGQSPGDTEDTLYMWSPQVEAGQSMRVLSHCTECHVPSKTSWASSP